MERITGINPQSVGEIAILTKCMATVLEAKSHRLKKLDGGALSPGTLLSGAERQCLKSFGLHTGNSRFHMAVSARPTILPIQQCLGGSLLRMRLASLC